MDKFDKDVWLEYMTDTSWEGVPFPAQSDSSKEDA